MSYLTLGGDSGTPLRLQPIDSNPLVQLTTRDGDTFYLAANEIVAVYPTVIQLSPSSTPPTAKPTTCLGSKVSLRGSDPDTFWFCTEEPKVVYERASRAQRRV